MMNPETKAKWIDALRSGEFDQAQATLQANGAYCCLGVLMCIQGMSPVAYYENQYADSDASDLDEYLHNELGTVDIPHEFRAGLTQEDLADLGARNDGGLAPGKDGQCSDPTQKYHGHTFAELADHIEHNL